ncbi:MAG TPA: hypothetical protein VG986_10615 [Pseudolabrys sp.]|nr:hypothetical protein [Pseudolabrys sp.]
MLARLANIVVTMLLGPMVGRLLVLIAMMLLGPLYIEVYLYHPMVAIEHDKAAMIPMVTSPLALFGGFLVLTVDSNRVTTIIFAITCTLAIATGVIGTAIHLALHTDSLWSLVSKPDVWLGQPPILVPLSFAAAGLLGLSPVFVLGRLRMAAPPVLSGRILEGIAAGCALVAAVSGAMVDGGTVALIAVIAALGFGSIGYIVEFVGLVYPLVRPGMS